MLRSRNVAVPEDAEYLAVNVFEPTASPSAAVTRNVALAPKFCDAVYALRIKAVALPAAIVEAPDTAKDIPENALTVELFDKHHTETRASLFAPMVTVAAGPTVARSTYDDEVVD